MIGHRDDLIAKTKCQGSKVNLGRKLHKLGLAAHLAISIHWQELEEMNQMCVFLRLRFVPKCN
jgi:hypothetical protein